MRALFHRFLVSTLWLTFSANAQVTQDLTIVRSGSGFTLQWHAAAGTTQLVWKQTLADSVTWQVLPGSAPKAGGLWETPFEMPVGRAFFTLKPPVAPVAPPGLRLALVGGNFRLQWDSTSDASGYKIYIGLGPNVGPANNVGSLTLSLANSLEIVGLTAGQTYYLAIAATNAAGEGALSAPLAEVFGPKGSFSGIAVQPLPLSDGTQFQVAAEGAVISIYDPTHPAGPYLSATADAKGYFRIPFLRPGTYPLSYDYQGVSGSLATNVTVTETGTSIAPLVLPTPAPQVGSRLTGTLTLSNGDVARFDLDEFSVHERGQVTAMLANGGQVIAVPDASGAWAFTSLPNSYPITLVGSYHGLQTSRVIGAPQGVLTRIDLQFSQALPKVQALVATQNGLPTGTLVSGVAASFSAILNDASLFPATPRWVAKFNGQTLTSTAVSPSFVFNQPPGPAGPGFGDPLDGGTVFVTFYPSELTTAVSQTAEIEIRAAAGGALLAAPPTTIPTGPANWSGTVTTWHPNPAVALGTGHPATVTVKSGTGSQIGASTTVTAGGYFEMPVDPELRKPYLVRVEKPAHMRFLWPFEQRLPLEAQFSVVPADQSIVPLEEDGWIVGNLDGSGAYLYFNPGSLLDIFNVPWTGDIRLNAVAFRQNAVDFTLDPYPWPPGAEVRGPGLRNGIYAYMAVYFDVTTPTGLPLHLSGVAGAVQLGLPTIAGVTAANVPSYLQIEPTGYFERVVDASMESPGRYVLRPTVTGLFMIGGDASRLQVVISPDRTLNYPFDALVAHSIFPVTVQGPALLNTGPLYLPQGRPVHVEILDLKQAPGLFFSDPGAGGAALLATQKTVILRGNYTPVLSFPLQSPPSSTVQAISLANVEPKLNSVMPSAIPTLNAATHFFSRPGVNTANDARAYYAQINTPTTLTEWRATRGLPARFGGPLSGVSANDYSTAYYYNLGDLGFARAQTMRVKPSPPAPNGDGLSDVAFLVTNYKTIEDAIYGRKPIATVCMDYSALKDAGAIAPTRYTRFYVYGSNDLLLNEANLDGAGAKGIPNLCLNCHGGGSYKATDKTADLGSRFLPFDLESYAFHPKFGVQKPELARMNAAVLKTNKTVATANVIAGWYGNPNPLLNLNAFNKDYVPTYMPGPGISPWSANANMYNNVFKASCRVCHNSREGTSSQFDALGHFPISVAAFFGANTLDMPHGQRPWGIFWGSRCAVKLGASVPDAPTILQNAAGPPPIFR